MPAVQSYDGAAKDLLHTQMAAAAEIMNRYGQLSGAALENICLHTGLFSKCHSLSRCYTLLELMCQVACLHQG